MINEATIYAMVYMALPVLLVALMVLACLATVSAIVLNAMKNITELVTRQEDGSKNERGRKTY